ncbi:hypothetical protein IE53DRAFT_372362 [Violaceomyces palustris]|uniref:Uncharacterized protein n=1 Tax=Violaceomyces palustris TaxID=1673888 RepID=A0ACD0NL40_9BASI|nr:hypothetical protein IE53DRAFT_372362 [Violaceomyces palustris]
MLSDRQRTLLAGALENIRAPDSPLLRAYIGHHLFEPGENPYRRLTNQEILHLPADFLTGYATWAAKSIHPSEDHAIAPIRRTQEPGPSRSAPQADLSFNMAFGTQDLRGQMPPISHRRQRSDTYLGHGKNRAPPGAPGGTSSQISASAPATPSRQARQDLPPSPRSLKVSARETILQRWVPCIRCAKFGRRCLPPVAGDTKQVRCQACQEDRSHPACSTGRRLFGKQNKRDHHLPGGSTWNAIALSSDEDFEVLDEPPSPRQRPAPAQAKDNVLAPATLLPAVAAQRQNSAPPALPSVPLLRLPLSSSPDELVDELQSDLAEDEAMPQTPKTPPLRVSPWE